MRYVPTIRSPRSIIWSIASSGISRDSPPSRPGGRPVYCRRISGSGKNVKTSLSTCLAIEPDEKTGTAPAADVVNDVFYNQALNTFYNYGSRPFLTIEESLLLGTAEYPCRSRGTISTHSARQLCESSDIYVTDPPYADAINYH